MEEQNIRLVKEAYAAYGRGDVASDWVHVFTIEDGRIAAFREFLDSHLAAAACQASASG
jgi:ketosteroid isomerase-like protein